MGQMHRFDQAEAFPVFSDRQTFSQTVGTSYINGPQATSWIIAVVGFQDEEIKPATTDARNG
jgi:hypothetical protein